MPLDGDTEASWTYTEEYAFFSSKPNGQDKWRYSFDPETLLVSGLSYELTGPEFSAIKGLTGYSKYAMVDESYKHYHHPL
jgi:hypothetical protein